jgi:uncharacterized protein (DUF1015 family)
MAEIRPFRGLRYQTEAGSLEKLIAPPSDVLTPELREDYANRSELNVVILSSPVGGFDDRSKFVKYSQSAATLAQMRRAGYLAAEAVPAFYRVRHSSTHPGEDEPIVRTALLALVLLDSSILPTEVTIPSEREHRLRLLEATRSQLEAPSGLYEDPDGRVAEYLNRCEYGAQTTIEGDDGVIHRLDPITDSEQINTLESLFAGKKIWIEESQALYESALAFRNSQSEHTERIPEDYLFVSLTAISDPGLVALARHRIVTGWKPDPTEAISKLSPWFDIHETHTRNLVPMMRHASGRGRQAFGVAFEGGKGFLLVRQAERGNVPDVVALHDLVLREGLGFTGRESIQYAQDETEVLRAVNEGRGVAFLLNPPREQDLIDNEPNRVLRPTQSTYLFPKVPTGLVMWSLNDWA